MVLFFYFIDGDICFVYFWKGGNEIRMVIVIILLGFLY